MIIVSNGCFCHICCFFIIYVCLLKKCIFLFCFRYSDGEIPFFFLNSLPMSKIDEVRSAMVAAMKAKDKDTKETLSALLAALKNKAIDKRADLTEEEEVQVILKEIKQTKETLEMTPADRTDIIEECEKRIAVLEQYAPKMMDEAEIKEVIAGVLSGLGIDAPTPKDKGRIMKELMPKVKGKADGKLVNDILTGMMA